MVVFHIGVVVYQVRFFSTSCTCCTGTLFDTGRGVVIRNSYVSDVLWVTKHFYYWY